MLLLLFLVHHLTRNGAAAHLPLPLNPRSEDACDDINNCRTLFGLVWGCLTTIFACTWVSVHPNVPERDQSTLALFWRRLEMMLIAIIAPELMVGFATRQYVVARQLSKEYELSMTNAFFLCMGGFVSGKSGYVVATKKQLEDEDSLNAIRNLKAEDIQDKSKGDAFSKGIALAQLLWFTTQCIARVHQQLAVTELEVATMAFAVMNVFTWLLWWHKPLDVQRQIVINGRPEAPLPAPVRMSLVERVFAAIYTKWDSENPSVNPQMLTSVPGFWSPEMSGREGGGYSEHFARTFPQAFSGTVFGAIHCAAWNADFPTAEEMWIWRVCSTVIAALPFTLVCGTLLLGNSDMLDMVGVPCWALLLFIYIVARLILIILPFLALRFLPPSAYTDVNWSLYIPHL